MSWRCPLVRAADIEYGQIGQSCRLEEATKALLTSRRAAG